MLLNTYKQNIKYTHLHTLTIICMNMTSETLFLELLLTFLLKDKNGGDKNKILYYNPYKTDITDKIIH